jgi:dinuclear metal center YbgI/SA1388 family protein
MKIKDIIQILESIAPKAYQESYDNSGLNIGNTEADITGVLCTIDVTEALLDEAIDKGDNLIIAHHPLIFHELKSITGRNTIERIVIKAIKHDIAIYIGHTNFDNIPEGVNARICEKLNIKNYSILSPLKEHLNKLVCFVPTSHAENVRNAIFEAGAGHIGNYDCCSFNSEGSGSFRGLDNSKQFVGEKGTLHFEKEVKIEVVLPRFLKSSVLSALLKVHPYEEVAYDFYALANDNNYAGAGMIGELDEYMTLSELLEILKKTFHADGIRYTGELEKRVKRIAVCGGSGSFLINEAKTQNADVFITGDMKYHQFLDNEKDLSIIDIGHYESEQFTKDIFYESVKKKMPKFAVHLSEVKTNPIKYFK